MTWRSVVTRLEDAMCRHAARVAVESPEGAWTFAQLDQASLAIAAQLRRIGVGPQSIVALDLGPGIEYVAALVGVWRAGGAFLPMPRDSPPARLAEILGRSGAGCVLELATIRRWLAQPCAMTREREILPDDAAYIIFSSGSTGRPKGVVVEHRGLPAVLTCQIERFELLPGDRSLWVLSTAFDASISDIGTALLSGSTLVIPAPGSTGSVSKFVRTLRDAAITYVDLPPALLAVLDPDALPPSLRTIVIGGEVCPPAVVRAFATRCRLINVYGPTEATICTSAVVCSPAWDVPDLGEPLDGVRYRLHEDGELWIGGPGVAREYLGEPKLSAERFVSDAQGRWFRSGDRVRVDAHGRWVFCGRIDRQFKHRGRLVDPHEVEAALLEHATIREAAVVQRSIAGGPPTIVAFVVADLDDPATWRAALQERVPPWMVPSRFERMTALPRTPTGKIDGPALAALPLGGERPPTSPTPVTSGALEQAWCVALGTADARPEHDFFSQGGDSVAVLALVAAAHARGIPLSAADVYRARSLGALARLVSPGHRDARSVAWLGDQVQVELRDLAAPTVSAPPDGPGALLVTGATGALVSRMLAAWPAHRRRVIALVRARDDAHARARLSLAMRTWGREIPAGVEAWAGDLQRPALGLSARAWSALASSVTDIVHAGAQVHVAAPYAVLHPCNVGGTREIVRLARAGHARLIHISTLSVLLETDAPQDSEHECDDMGSANQVFGGYAQSKWVAERLVREGLDAPRRMVIRLGLLTGDAATGCMPGQDQLSRTIRGLARLGVVPPLPPAAAFDVTPVDEAAQAVLDLMDWASHARGPLPTVHVAGHAQATAAELCAAMARAGIVLREVPAEAFWRSAEDCSDADVTMARVSVGQAGQGSLFLATGRTFGTARADALVGRRALAEPLARVLDRYVERALDPMRSCTPPMRSNP